MTYSYKLVLSLVVVMLTLASCSGDEEAKLQKKIAKTEKKIADLSKELATLKESYADLVGIEEADAPAENVDLVTVQTLRDTTFKHFIEVQGETSTEKNVLVSSDMGGIALGILATEGTFYRAGTPLVRLDNATLQSNIAELETSLQLATDVYQKQERLWQQNIGSELQYLQAKNNKESLEKKLATLRVQLNKTTVRAPISGYVDEIFIKQGEMLAPGAPAMRMINLSQMKVEASVPEAYLTSVRVGEEVEVYFPALDVTKVAKIQSTGQFINPANRTFKVHININNKEGRIKPNLLAEIRINDYTNEETITIPSRILQQSVDGYFVFTAAKDSTDQRWKAQRKRIEIGKSYDGITEVKEGLSKGEIIIDEGYRDVRNEGLIEIDSTGKMIL